MGGLQKKLMSFGWAKQSIENICNGGGSRKIGMCGRESTFERGSTAEKWTIRLYSNMGG